MNKKPVTRFAPSPTGFLHIGGARTALFNWLFARRNCGQFLLRIEDTDRKRSTQEAIDAILDVLQWLGLEWDQKEFFQAHHEQRHKDVALELLENGHAYKCFCTQEELTAMRAEAEKQGKIFQYDRRWRDKTADAHPKGAPYSIRLKAPLTGETVIEDEVQGRVVVQNQELDDLVLLRSDGTPTYMLAVVVDDHDMAITHIIRGDDHLNNAFKQKVIFEAMGWDVPVFAHIPLIHGADGAKLSKRHGALGVDAYRDMGYLPEAVCNYLARLGWSHGDDEIFSREQAAEWFDLGSVGKSPARFDMEKLKHVNAHYIKQADNQRLSALLHSHIDMSSNPSHTLLMGAIELTKERASTLPELAENLGYFIARPAFTEKARAALEGAKTHILALAAIFFALSDWEEPALKEQLDAYIKQQELNFAAIGKPLRAALIGDLKGPSLTHFMAVIGRDETINRLKDID